MFPGLPILALLCAIAAGIVFFGACVLASADAQGAIGFIFALPILFFLLGSAYAMSSRKLSRLNRFTRVLVGVFSFYLLIFYLGAAVPGLRFIAHATVGGAAQAFETVTGRTPYAYFREKNRR